MKIIRTSRRSEKFCLAGAEQEVEVIVQQRPSEAIGTGLNEEICKAGDEHLPVFVIEEDVALFNISHDHVLQEAWQVDSSGTWH